MRQIRSCLAIFCFALFGVGGLIVGTILFPLIIVFCPPKNKRLILARTVRASWIFFVRVMSSLRLIEVTVSGLKNFKNIKSHIIVANHPTLLDVVLLVSIVPNCICVVKNALLKNFFIKNIIQHAYLVNGDSTEDFLNKGKEILSKGLNIVIFPEGTRTDNNYCNKIHRGFAQLALRSEVPILPVQITCTPLILGKSQKWYDVKDKRVKYHICFLSPIKTSLNSELSIHHQAKVLSQTVCSKLFKRTD